MVSDDFRDTGSSFHGLKFLLNYSLDNHRPGHVWKMTDRWFLAMAGADKLGKVIRH